MRVRDVQSRQHLAAALALVFAATGCADDDNAVSQRQADVADRGAEVMPFDLDSTTHVFDKTSIGGVQTVVADDSSHMSQIELIRRHLRDEREKFARGDFGDPVAIHGHDMAGVAQLQQGYAEITVEYLDRPDGAQLIYRTDVTELVDALHAWFDQQVMDHGPHAEGG